MSLRRQLELMLSEDTRSCCLREETTFDALTESASGVVLFGAGGLGRKVLSALRTDGIEPLAFVDNRLAGQFVDGIPVRSLRDGALRWGRSAAFVVTIWASWADTMRQQVQSLHDLGCEIVVPFLPLLWKYRHLLPHVQIDLPSRALAQKDRISHAFELWSDDQSKEEFLGQLKWRLCGEFDELGHPWPDQYWQKDLINLPVDSVYVDAGAFNGDTLEQFISFSRGTFRRAFLCEPDQENRRSIEKRLHEMPDSVRKKVDIIPFAIGDRECDLPFKGGTGASSMAGTGADTVHCVTIDDAIPEAPHLIKYDIEGFELAGLEGSSQTVAKHAPHLTVCVYHKQNHLWEVPLLIHSLNPDYRFYLRPHGQIWESVCYAVPISAEAAESSGLEDR